MVWFRPRKSKPRNNWCNSFRVKHLSSVDKYVVEQKHDNDPDCYSSLNCIDPELTYSWHQKGSQFDTQTDAELFAKQLKIPDDTIVSTF